MEIGSNIFSFSNIKSQHIFKISNCNSFNYNFSNYELNNDKNNINNILIQKKKIRKHFIKNINLTFPSNEKFQEENFRNEFFINYDDSFANFCGINEKMFAEIYNNNYNQYIPKINKMGDINVDVDKIFENLKAFSDSKKVKTKKMFFNKKGKFQNLSENLIADKVLKRPIFFN